MSNPQTLRDLAESVTIIPQTDIEVVRLVEAVKAHSPQIVRTIDQLNALDPETQLCHWPEHHDDPVVMTWVDWVNDYEIDGQGVFPLAVIATGDQVRATREALEEQA